MSDASEQDTENEVRHIQYLIVGQGLAGSLLAWELMQINQTVLVVDNNSSTSASRTSAGLINPITGQRMVKTPNVDVYMPVAREYYANLEEQFDTPFYFEKPLLRLFQSSSELDRFKKRKREAEYAAYLGDMFLPGSADEPVNDSEGGFEQQQTGYVDVQLLMRCIQSYLIDNDSYVEGSFKLSDAHYENGNLRWQNYEVQRVIYCDGANAKTNPVFGWLPFQLSKGEVITVENKNYYPEKILSDGNWVLPVEKPRCKVGATYEWEWENELPSEPAKQELLDAYQRITDDDAVEIVEHKAGIRPTTKDKQPFLGSHPTRPNFKIFNGFGSKGALTVPFYAQHFVRYLIQGDDLLDVVDIGRFDITKSPVTVAQRLLSGHLHPGDIAIDATVGNGHDTLLLASCVGNRGRVFGFDIQQEALDKTQQLLQQYQQEAQVYLVNGGHENVFEFVPADLKHKISAICFNLGYLPGSEKDITTQAPTTIIALTKIINYLKPGGVLTIVCYPGHPGGQEELEAVIAFSKKLPSSIFQVKRFVGGDDLKTAPQLIFIRLAEVIR